MTSLVDKILSCHQALAASDVPYAFGGALALAWCTQAARGTIDIDINLFVPAQMTRHALAALPGEVGWDEGVAQKLQRDTQIRLWWDNTPVDVFLNNTPFHEQVQQRIRWETFGGERVPFLCCNDLAVFKAFFNRTKDWADIEAMYEAGTLDMEQVTGTISSYLGIDDERLIRLQGVQAAYACRNPPG